MTTVAQKITAMRKNKLVQELEKTQLYQSIQMEKMYSNGEKK